MKKLILFSLILSFSIMAQKQKQKVYKSLNELTPEEIDNMYIFKSHSWDGELTEEEKQQNKYIAFKPMSWNELQLHQLDSLKPAEELQLAEYCPTTLKKL